MEGTSASCVPGRTRPQSSDRLSSLKQNHTNQFDPRKPPYKCCNGTKVLISNKTFDKDTTIVQKKPEVRQNNSALHNRRPSGLPLVNRRMTPNDVIMLETYRTQTPETKLGNGVGDPSFISNVNMRTQSARLKSINLYHGHASNV